MGRTGGSGSNQYHNNKLITAQDSENLNRFFNDIKKYEQLGKAQEIELIRQYQRDKSQPALDKLIQCNLRFVVTVAKTYQNQGVPLLDIIQEGSSGMIEAADRYDTEKYDIRFCSYAVWWIKIKIISSFELQKRLIQLPANRTLLITKLRRKVQELEESLHRLPTVEELRKYFPSQSESDIQEAFSYTLLPLSLQSEFFEGQDENITLGDVLKAPNALEVDGDDTINSLSTDLNRLLFQVPQQCYDVLVFLQGLNEEEVMRVDKLAYLLEVDIKEVVRMKAKGMKFLKKYRSQTTLNSYL